MTPTPSDGPEPFSQSTALLIPVRKVPRVRSVAAAIWTILLLAGLVLGGLYLPGGLKLVAIAAAVTGILVTLGLAIVGRVWGPLINENNLMSLSRLQMAVWTVLILAAYFAVVLARIRAGESNPLNVEIDPHLLALIGIGTTSLVASPLILSTKKEKEPDAQVTAKTAQKTGETTGEIDANRQGTLYANASIEDARFTDIFQGDEVGNALHVDLAKVQLFFFTVIAALTYFVAVLKLLNDRAPAELTALPIPSEKLVWLIGISHAGYLGNKGLDHTRLQS